MQYYATPVIAGLVTGTGLILVFALIVIYSHEHYGPPTMYVIVGGQGYRMGYGSYGGDLPLGGGFGADVDSSRTLPKFTVNLTRGSAISFSFRGLSIASDLDPRDVWVTEISSSSDQYFLAKTSHGDFLADEDIPDGEYILTVRARWSMQGYAQGGVFNSHIRIHS
jgi:hypothetical protein